MSELEETKKNMPNKNEEYNTRIIVHSHAFQEKLAVSPEFADILRDVKKAAKIKCLKEEISSEKSERGWLEDKKTIAFDKGTNYENVQAPTLSEVSYEFYRRHKDDMADILGQDNLDFLNKLVQDYQQVMFLEVTSIEKYKNEYYKGSNDAYLIDEKLKDIEDHFNPKLQTNEILFLKTPLAKGIFPVSFNKELLLQKCKPNQKILLAQKELKDDEYGNLTQFDGYIYDGLLAPGRKYHRFYQSYGSSTAYNTVSITKAMQQKMHDTVPTNPLADKTPDR